jgi:acetaldehyde dehydrogenase
MLTSKTQVAIIGSGNIGTDLMMKVMRLSNVLEMGKRSLCPTLSWLI